MDIPHLPGYQFSNLGNMRSVDRVVLDSKGVRQRRKGQPIKRRQDGNGYHFYTSYHQGKRFELYVHVALLELFKGEPKPFPTAQVRHLNDVNTDNRLENLAWGTPRDNGLDAVRNGRNTKSNQTECLRGHRLELPNLVVRKFEKGHRSCLACARAGWYLRSHPDEDMQIVSDRYYAKIMKG